MAKKSKVVTKDLGYVRAIKELNRVDRVFISVGIHGDEGQASLIASVHEFGSPSQGIPQRSFIRSTLDERRDDIAKVVERTLDKVSRGKQTVESGLGIVGLFVENAIKKKITTLRDPPNAPSTIAQKGSSNPLIDKGDMRQSITHKVQRGQRPKGQV